MRLGDRSWECDCPVGVTGAFCKHCAAVVIAVEDEGASPAAPPGGDHDPVGAWLDGLAAPDLRELLRSASALVDGAGDFLAREYLAANDDLTELAAEVDSVLRSRRSFYAYGQANSYARDAQGILDILHDRRDRPSVELLTIMQRAITLTVRTTLRSDDSSTCIAMSRAPWPETSTRRGAVPSRPGCTPSGSPGSRTSSRWTSTRTPRSFARTETMCDCGLSRKLENGDWMESLSLSLLGLKAG